MTNETSAPNRPSLAWGNHPEHSSYLSQVTVLLSPLQRYEEIVFLTIGNLMNSFSSTTTKMYLLLEFPFYLFLYYLLLTVSKLIRHFFSVATPPILSDFHLNVISAKSAGSYYDYVCSQLILCVCVWVSNKQSTTRTTTTKE